MALNYIAKSLPNLRKLCARAANGAKRDITVVKNVQLHKDDEGDL